MRSTTRPDPHIPAFYAVPARVRRDGWTPLRQAEFIGWLAQTRSVAQAAAKVGMAREGAYRLRTREWADSFNVAWDAAMWRPSRRASLRGQPERWPDLPRKVPLSKVTTAELLWRMESGSWQVILRGGIYRGVRHKPDNSAVLALVSRGGSCA